MRVTLHGILLLWTLFGAATAEYLVTTPAGDEIPVNIYPADGDTLILWLPSEFGIGERRIALGTALGDVGLEVWAPDLHAAWFLPAGRYSLNDIDPQIVQILLDEAIRVSGKRVVLMATGRTVALALRGARQWQQRAVNSRSLIGLLAFSPRLFARTPQGGDRAEYLPIASASNLPIYILQPQDSSGIWRIGEDFRQLEKGGSPVFLHRLPGVSDGFFGRAEYTETEAAMTNRLPGMLRAAIGQLDEFDGAPTEIAPIAVEDQAPESSGGDALLRPYPEPRPAPPLLLTRLNGERADLADLGGRVVLLNFWATWCPPCVEEIPSLQSLYEQLRPEGLEILAVDVGESAETVKTFLADKPVTFPVLLDPEGRALRRWGVYAFPTTLVLDRDHHIRYAVFGAFDWSSEEVIETLTPLLKATPR